MKKDNSNSTNNPLTDHDLELLQSRIVNSINKYDSRKKIRRLIISSAASITILFGIGYKYLNKNESRPSINEIVDIINLVDPNSVNEITLVLSEDSKININEQESNIQYDDKGTNINIGENNNVTQENKSKENPLNTLIVPFGKRANLTLSDGTKIWLNSGTTLVYPPFFKGDIREVFIQGEAIFDVAHNAEKPFVVVSESQEIKVLGTVFCVSVYKDEAEKQTILQQGSVELKFKGKTEKSIKLSPGMVSRFTPKNGTFNVSKENIEKYFTWREGYLSLEKNNLQYIMSRLSRYYNKKIIIEDESLNKLTYSGRLDLKSNIEEVLVEINKTSNFNIIKQDEMFKLIAN